MLRDLAVVLVALGIVGFGLWLLILGTPSPIRHGPARSRFLLRILDGACRLYAGDNRGHFPPSSDPAWGLEGRYLLCQLLTGYAPAGEPKDGVEGFGYKLPSGRTVRPYLDVSQFAMAPGPGNSAVFRDRSGNDVYYYCQTRDWYLHRMRQGDLPGAAPFDGSHNAGGPADINRYVTGPGGASSSYLTSDFVLCTKGPDGVWGSKDPRDGVVRQNVCDLSEVDDITNFLPH